MKYSLIRKREFWCQIISQLISFIFIRFSSSSSCSVNVEMPSKYDCSHTFYLSRTNACHILKFLLQCMMNVQCSFAGANWPAKGTRRIRRPRRAQRASGWVQQKCVSNTQVRYTLRRIVIACVVENRTWQRATFCCEMEEPLCLTLDCLESKESRKIKVSCSFSLCVLCMWRRWCAGQQQRWPWLELSNGKLQNRCEERATPQNQMCFLLVWCVVKSWLRY